MRRATLAHVFTKVSLRVKFPHEHNYYVHVNVHTRMFVCVCTHVHRNMCACIFTHEHMCMYMFVKFPHEHNYYVHIHVHTHIMFVCTCTCTHEHVCMYLYNNTQAVIQSQYNCLCIGVLTSSLLYSTGSLYSLCKYNVGFGLEYSSLILSTPILRTCSCNDNDVSRSSL